MVILLLFCGKKLKGNYGLFLFEFHPSLFLAPEMVVSRSKGDEKELPLRSSALFFGLSKKVLLANTMAVIADPHSIYTGYRH
jgi:hypothetical protein